VRRSNLGNYAISSCVTAFIETVYFDTQRWLIEKLFGWRGDDFERKKFAQIFDLATTTIVLVDGRDAGWLMVKVSKRTWARWKSFESFQLTNGTRNSRRLSREPVFRKTG
jgi:hypothetical protein